jgi:hypothetical protein
MGDTIRNQVASLSRPRLDQWEREGSWKRKKYNGIAMTSTVVEVMPPLDTHAGGVARSRRRWMVLPSAIMHSEDHYLSRNAPTYVCGLSQCRCLHPRRSSKAVGVAAARGAVARHHVGERDVRCGRPARVGPTRVRNGVRSRDTWGRSWWARRGYQDRWVRWHWVKKHYNFVRSIFQIAISIGLHLSYPLSQLHDG